MPRLEKTQDQVLSTTGIDGVLAKVQPIDWNKRVRKMRRDPTISYLRKLLMAPILTSDWTVTSDEGYKQAEQSIHSAFVPRRFDIIRNVIRGELDFGWQPFEMVWDYDQELNQVVLRKMKPLLQDITEILVNPHGDLVGVRNRPTYLSSLGYTGPWVDLFGSECLVFSHDVEGTNWYGEAAMRAQEGPYESWNECEAAAKRYDTKIAGAQWVIRYPEGTSTYNGQEDVDNFVVAQDIMRKLESSGKIAIPQRVLDQVEDLNQGVTDATRAWDIELITASSSSESQFVGRQKYLDALKARAIGIPERAVFEGQFGTKAEAEAHADFAIDNIQMWQTDIINHLNNTAVKFLLEMNFGKAYEDHVRLTASPLSDERRAFLRTLYMAYFQSQTGSAEEGESVDWDAIREEQTIPTRKDQHSMEKAESKGKVDQPGAEGNPDEPAAAALGEYMEVGQRVWMNNLKRIRSILDEVQHGTMSRPLAEQTLHMIGLPPNRVSAMLDAIEPDA